MIDISLSRSPDYKQSHPAMRACIETDSAETARLLINQGMDFDRYIEWADKQRYPQQDGGTFDAVKEYWVNMSQQEAVPDQDQDQTMGGM